MIRPDRLWALKQTRQFVASAENTLSRFSTMIFKPHRHRYHALLNNLRISSSRASTIQRAPYRVLALQRTAKSTSSNTIKEHHRPSIRVDSRPSSNDIQDASEGHHDNASTTSKTTAATSHELNNRASPLRVSRNPDANASPLETRSNSGLRASNTAVDSSVYTPNIFIDSMSAMPHLHNQSFMTPLASPQAGQSFAGSGLSMRQRPPLYESPTFKFAHGGAAPIARDHEKYRIDHITLCDVSTFDGCLISIGFFSEGASQLFNISCYNMNRAQSIYHERSHLLSLHYIFSSDELQAFVVCEHALDHTSNVVARNPNGTSYTCAASYDLSRDWFSLASTKWLRHLLQSHQQL